MSKIIVTIGCSNSGKSTWAHEEWLKNPLNTIIISRDNIRYMFGYTDETISEYYKRTDLNKLEKQVSKYEDTLIYEALCEDKTVIVDNTHLQESYITKYEYWNVEIELVWFDVLLKEALTRNMNRSRKVDESVIIKQYNKYFNLRKNLVSYSFLPKKLEQDINLPKCTLIDIDGTLAHMGDRRSPFDWAKVDLDYVDTQVRRVTNSLVRQSTNQVFICTGRDGSCLNSTQKWLNDNKIYYDKILIRKANDMRPDWQIKAEIWKQISKDYYIDFLIDDRMQVVRYGRALGLKVFQVEYNNF